ncbi:MAG: hypothetical protein KDA42_00100 [Planctomycetales bacterium]|nr:hypothetical protein [Planctomycetales bacterium]
MRLGKLLSVLAAFVLFVAPSLARAQDYDNDLALRAFEVIKKHCYNCHGANLEVPGLNVLDRESLTKKIPNELSYLVPNDLDNSRLWLRMGVDGDMPPKKVKDRPTAEEIETVKAWILDGGRFPQDSSREYLTVEDTLERISRHLRKTPREARKHQRYFTLTNIHNNPAYNKNDLRLYRAAFVKLVNSLSRNARIVQPTLIDAVEGDPDSGTIFNLDLTEVGWELDTWREVIKEYPYGLRWNDASRQDLSDEIIELQDELLGDGIPSIRVDWFVANASRPPAYHQLLGLPETLGELETKLGVDLKRDFKLDRLQRAAFAGSAVSKNNRLIDRHEGQIARYFYLSYDFGKSFGRGVLFRFPLGPKFEGNSFSEQAFEHDGNEIIWSLPNGMQAYMITNSEGKRIDAAPIEIVRDLSEISGTPQVVNGISCLGCHKHGTQPYQDAMGVGYGTTGDARQKIARLYAKPSEMSKLVESDKQEFLRTLQRVAGPYLQIGDDADKKLGDFPEMISTVARWYDKDVGPNEVALELGFRSADSLAIRGNLKLQELGMGPLADGHAIPRRMWHSRDEPPQSVFQRAAAALGEASGINPE